MLQQFRMCFHFNKFVEHQRIYKSELKSHCIATEHIARSGTFSDCIHVGIYINAVLRHLDVQKCIVFMYRTGGFQNGSETFSSNDDKL